MDLVIFASGVLGLSVIKKIHLEHDIKYIFTDKNSHSIISYSIEHNIPFFTGNPRKITDFSFFNDIKNCWAFSINYLYLLNQQMITFFSGRILNIHGALLPKYRGRTPHVWAIINGETECGITIHKIVKGVDAGDIVIQEKINITPEDTGFSILQKFEERYPELVLKAISKITNNSLTLVVQNKTKATYFPKRSPEDGLIDWSWQKERIINWVRALTKPYPGAFFYCNNDKIIVWECKISELGFNYEMRNGSIIKKTEKEIFIKCANGVIKITNYKEFIMNFKKLEKTCELERWEIAKLMGMSYNLLTLKLGPFRKFTEEEKSLFRMIIQAHPLIMEDE